jgi:formiminotetrahydrofolate cyclodeaminase
VTGHDETSALSLADFLDELEAPAPSRSGGTAAAATGAMAAALVAMVGRGSTAWTEGAGVAAQACTLRERLLELGDADARAYAAVLQAMGPAGEATQAERDFALGQALVVAALLPLAIAETSADVAELAALATVHGKESLRPDAAVAAALAEAAAHSGAHLVEVNLATMPGDSRSGRATELVEAARAARARALGAL